jgi:hypothetical protein
MAGRITKALARPWPTGGIVRLPRRFGGSPTMFEDLEQPMQQRFLDMVRQARAEGHDAIVRRLTKTLGDVYDEVRKAKAAKDQA